MTLGAGRTSVGSSGYSSVHLEPRMKRREIIIVTFTFNPDRVLEKDIKKKYSIESYNTDYTILH